MMTYVPLSPLLLNFFQGFLYKMRSVYAHFPINVSIGSDKKSMAIRNFLGEKYTRHVNMLEGVTVDIAPGQKDEFHVQGNDIELVSRSCKCSSLIIHLYV